MSIGLLLFYMNPESDPKMAFWLMGTGVFLASSSFLSVFLFFFKKIYYRGDVSLQTMNASVRQGILLSVWGILMIALRSLHIYEPRLILTVWLTLGCLEVMIQAVD
jgi:hypothetical protein